MKKIYTLSILFLFNCYLSAQCSLYPVSLSDRLNNSALVIEGQVLSQKSFWNTTGNYIYTSNLISIKRFLKGRSLVTKLEVITEGGEIDQKKQTVEPSLQLKPGDEGIFTLNSFEEVPSQFGFSTYKAYADIQGFISYDPRDESASDPFAKYNSINKDLYPKLNAGLGITLSNYVNISGKGYSSGTIASVTGFSPTTITAGTSSMITITGAGFGTVQGTSYVEFYNADDGGSTYIQPHSSQYVSWSNTQIQVMVPTRASTVSGTAGTGPIRVTVAGSPTVSAQTLTVNYGELNVYYSTNNTIYNTRHADLNGSAGITWQMYTSFDANTSAKTSFLSSLQTWRCNTYINWGTGSTTTVNTIAADGTDVVRFDIGSELPVGVLGRCTSYFSGCITGTVVNWYVSELDICFDDPSTSAITWQFGPTLASGSQYDFESVALHELGHGHQLSHVINSSDVMHYALSNAQNKRTLITNNINGGNDVMIRNVSTGVCGLNAMVALSATACSLSAPTASFNLAGTACVGQAITFTDASTGSPTSWSWTITGGSASSSTLQNPSTSYASAGNYSISLAATNAFGTSTILTKTVSVLANPNLTVAAATICSGTSTVLTVSGASSYTWNPGSLSGAIQTLSPLSSTNYTILGSNGSCTTLATSSVMVISTPTINVPNASICSGASTLIMANGASSYTWNPGNLNGNSQNLNPAATTVYTISGSNSGCNSTSQFTIDVTTTPTVSVNSASICSGNSAVLTASGATSFTWIPGNLTGNSQNLNPSASTIYTLTGANGSCTNSTTTTLNVTSTPTLSVSDASICSGTSTLLTVTGASAYTWMPGSLSGASQNLNPSGTTVYTITGTIGTCTSAITTTVNITTTPTVSASNASICPGSSISITAIGASGYTWMPGNLIGGSQTLNPSSPTIYTITGMNGNCINTKTLSVHVYTVFQVFGIANPAAICYGQSSSLAAGNGMSYTWTAPSYSANGSVPPAVSPSVTTVYNLAGFDGTCVTTTTVSLTVNPLPTVTAPNASVCSGGSISLIVSGADSYTWNPGNLLGSTQTFTPGSTGIYTVKGQYTATSCSSLKNFTLTVLPLPAILPVATPTAVCFGGTSSLTATGGISYTWNPGVSMLNPLAVTPTVSTIYTVTGFDGNCSNTATINLPVNPNPTITVPTMSICSGQQAFPNVTSTVATSFTWNPGNLISFAPTLTPNITTVYTVTGRSAQGCSASANTTVFVAPTPSVTVSVSNLSLCVGESTTITASGATSYAWDFGVLTGPVLVLTPTIGGLHTVTGVLGACTHSVSYFLVVGSPPPFGLSSNSISLCSSTSTTLQAGGLSTYTWNPGGTTGSSLIVSPSVTTTYTVSGHLGANFCATLDVVTVSVITTPTLSTVLSQSLICSGGGATISASGANTYTWQPGNLTGASIIVNPLVTTAYQVTGSILSCTASATETISVNPSPVITTSFSSNSICSGNSCTLSVSGTANTYTWDPGLQIGSTVTVSPLSPIVYTVTASNAFNCASTKTVFINVTPSPTLSYVNTPMTYCAGQHVTLTASGATNYIWSPASISGSTISVTPLTTSHYTLTGTSAGCTSTLQIPLTPYPNPTLNITAVTNTICTGETAVINVTGANIYQWQPGNLTGSIVMVTPQANISYTIIGTSMNGCSSSSIQNIFINVTPTLAVAGNQIILCAGQPMILNATGAMNYTWAPGNFNGSTISFIPSSTSTYTLNGETNGCKSELQFTVTVNNCTGIKDFSESNNYRIFPNPFNSELNLDFGFEFNGKVELYNSLGQIIFVNDIQRLDKVKMQLPEIAKGAYLLKIAPHKAGAIEIIKLLKD